MRGRLTQPSFDHHSRTHADDGLALDTGLPDDGRWLLRKSPWLKAGPAQGFSGRRPVHALGLLRGTNRPTKRAFRAGHTGFDQDRHFRDERGPLPAQVCAELVPEPSTASTEAPSEEGRQTAGSRLRALPLASEVETTD